MAQTTINEGNEVRVTTSVNGPGSFITASPRQAADARVSMILSWNTTDGMSMELLRHLERERPTFFDEFGPVDHDQWARDHVIKSAELVWVSPPMCELLAVAANAMPDVDFHAVHPNLVCIFSTPMERLVGDHNLPVHALHWHNDICDTYLFDVSGRGVCVASSSSSHLHTAAQRSGMKSDVKILVALHALMASPGVSESHRINVDRPGRRRAERMGVDDPAVRVIYLRNLQRQDRSNSDGDDQRYRHQWIVAGHWRQQPHGPGRSLRRFTWISPYLKGPADAPLLTGDKVRALVR